MIKLFYSILFSLFFIGGLEAQSVADEAPRNIVGDVELSHSYILRDWDSHAGDDRVAAIGGMVEFAGSIPFVTIYIGGQEYTTRTDQVGRFSVLVYANERTFTVEAWQESPFAGRSERRSAKSRIQSSF